MTHFWRICGKFSKFKREIGTELAFRQPENDVIAFYQYNMTSIFRLPKILKKHFNQASANFNAC